MKKGPFKLKGFSGFVNSPVKQNEIPENTGSSDHEKTLTKYNWSGLTREEAKATVRFSQGGAYEREKKRKFYEIYGELNR